MGQERQRGRSRRPGAALALCALLLIAAAGAAQEAGGRPLIVGTKHAPPFAIRSPEGTWSGLSIDLWRRVAQDLRVTYELRETDLEGLLAKLEDGSLDVVAAALTVTADRETRMDFSHPFHSSGLGIAVKASAGSGRGMAWRGLFSVKLLQVLGLLLLALFATGSLVWILERRRNPEQFGGSAGKGLGSGFWWSAVTMTTVGYGDKAPVTPGGRAVAIVWMFLGLILASTVTAAITSSLTLAGLEPGVRGPEDLPSVQVGTVQGSTSADYLRENRIRSQSFPAAEAALAALAKEKVEAVVYDAPILQHLVDRNFENQLKVLPHRLESQDYAFGLPSGSSLREPLNRALLSRTAGTSWRELVGSYLGE